MREQRSCRCYSPGVGAAASANGLPSESRHTAHRSPGVDDRAAQLGDALECRGQVGDGEVGQPCGDQRDPRSPYGAGALSARPACRARACSFAETPQPGGGSGCTSCSAGCRGHSSGPARLRGNPHSVGPAAEPDGLPGQPRVDVRALRFALARVGRWSVRRRVALITRWRDQRVARRWCRARDRSRSATVYAFDVVGRCRCCLDARSRGGRLGLQLRLAETGHRDIGAAGLQLLSAVA